MWDRRAKYVENYDGDSVDMILDQGFHDTKEIHIRLANVWAPEMKDPGGPEVQSYIQEWYTKQEMDYITEWNFVVWIHRMVKADREQMTFNRYVATVYSIRGGNSLNSDVMKYIAEKGYGPGVQVIHQEM